MANLTEIKSAKELGKLMQKSRESQRMSILGLANLSGLSVRESSCEFGKRQLFRIRSEH
jgi:hypothetical protein